MSHGYAGAVFTGEVVPGDGPHVDSFGRQRVSEPTFVFDSQFTYSLQPLMWQPVTNGAGATVTHDTVNRCAVCSFTNTPTGGKAFLETFEHFRYQPGRSQLVEITFVMGAAVANVTRFARYGTDAVNIEFQQDGTNGLKLVLKGATDAGTQTVAQANWNRDKLDGTGPSGITFDATKSQILVIDFQALYVGRVRVGFNIDGETVWVHYFRHANRFAFPYIQTANLPLGFGMTCTGTATATMLCVCSSVKSEGGQLHEEGIPISYSFDVTATGGARTHAISLRPRATYQGIQNRSKFVLESVEVLGGLNGVLVEMAIGQAITGASYANVNTTHSAMEVSTAGALSGSPELVIGSGVVATGGGAAKEASQFSIGGQRVPITLDTNGNPRALGTLTILLTGKGGNSACTVVLNWREIH